MFAVWLCVAAIAAVWVAAIATVVRSFRKGDGKMAVAELVVDFVRSLFE